MSKTSRVLGIMAASGLLPSQAAAFDFGFVRVPDFLDRPILIAAVLTFAGFVFLKKILPKGLSFNEVDEAERTPAMTVSAYFTALTLMTTLGLLFVGMGLQRYLEWGA